jgi:hypothetical protein
VSFALFSSWHYLCTYSEATRLKKGDLRYALRSQASIRHLDEVWLEYNREHEGALQPTAVSAR